MHQYLIRKKFKSLLFRSTILFPCFFIGYVLRNSIILYFGKLNLFFGQGYTFLPFVFFLFTALWLVSPFGESCRKKGGFLEACFNILPIEFMLFLIFAQWHFVAAVLTAIVILTVQSLCAFKIRKRKAFDSKKNKIVLKRVFLLMTSVVLIVPSIISLFVYKLESPHYEADDDTFAEMEILENTPPFLCFKSDLWESYSPQEKITELQYLCDYEAQKLGIPSVKISTKKLNSYVLGSHISESEEIIIDLEHLEDDTSENVVSTCLHEIYHSYQAYVVKNIDWDSELAKSEFCREAALWKDNLSNYTSGLWDYDTYKKQPLEIDAKNFAEKECEEIFSNVEK